jgi:hypothetical protein
MALKEHLTAIFDVFSRRLVPRGQGFKPDVVSENTAESNPAPVQEVFAGNWGQHPWARPSNYTHEFWEGMGRTLQHLYGRPKLSDMRTNSAAEDAISFVAGCEPQHFFDFLELTFKADCLWRVVSERNDLVNAINEIFRIEAAPYQLTREVTRQEPSQGPYPRGTTVHTVAWPKVIRMEEEATHRSGRPSALRFERTVLRGAESGVPRRSRRISPRPLWRLSDKVL